MKPLRLEVLAASVLTTAAMAAVAAPAGAAAGPSNEWLGLARQMAEPWPALQLPDGSFRDYVVAAAPRGPARDPYGRAFLGLALLQAGLRDGDEADLRAAFRALRQAALHPVAQTRVVFENLALATAYNVARANLAGDVRFAAIRPALERRLRQMRVVQFGGKRPYYNYYLVESAALAELLRSGLRSAVPGSALARRAHTQRLVVSLVNRQLERIAARYTTHDAAGTLAVLSDPPWNPPAYDAFSLALLSRVVKRLRPAAATAPRELMRRMARSLWALASPQGSVSYFGRSQDQSWTLAMTAYGAESAAALPGTSMADAGRFEALAARALARLRGDYAGGRFGFWITPAMKRGPLASAIPGIDAYADAASYSGLTLVGLNWALEAMDPQGPLPGPLAADLPGVHRVGRGNGAVAIVRSAPSADLTRPALWYVVKQGPGTDVKGVGDYHDDIRYDSGLMALESISADGTPTPVLPARPHPRRRDDRAEPVLVRHAQRARFWGTSLEASAAGDVQLRGGFRAGSRWWRRGVSVAYMRSGCGLSESIPTRRGDDIEQALWFRGTPSITNGGRTLSDRVQRVLLSATPRSRVARGGYASGTEQQLTRLTMRFRGTGKPLTFEFCPAGPGS